MQVPKQDLPVPRPITPQELIDLILLGLWWLNADRAGDPSKAPIFARPGRSIVRVLHMANAISDGRYISAAKDARVIDLVMQQGHLLKCGKNPGRRDMEVLIQVAPHPFVTLVIPSNKFDYFKLLGPDGYRWVITAAGEERARSIADSYADLVTREAFLATWATYRRQVVAIASAIRHNQRKTTSSLTQQRSKAPTSLPEAPVAEEDWEF